MTKDDLIKVELGGGKKSPDVKFTADIVRIGSRYYYKNSDMVTLVKVGSKRRYFRVVSPLIEKIDGVYYKKSTVQMIDGVRTSIYAADVVECPDGYHLKKHSIQIDGKWWFKNDPKIVSSMVVCDISGRTHPKSECIPYVKTKNKSGIPSETTSETFRTYLLNSERVQRILNEEFGAPDDDLPDFARTPMPDDLPDHTQATPMPDPSRPVMFGTSGTVTSTQSWDELVVATPRRGGVTISQEPSAPEAKVNSELTNPEGIGYVHNKYEDTLIIFEENYYRKRDCVYAYDSDVNDIIYAPKDRIKNAPKNSSIFHKFDSDWSGDLSRARTVRYAVDRKVKGTPQELVKIELIELPFTSYSIFVNNYFDGYQYLWVRKVDEELFKHCVLFFYESSRGSLTPESMAEYAKVIATNHDEIDINNLNLDFRNSGASDRWVNSGNNKIAKTFDRVAGLEYSVGIEVETSGGSISDKECVRLGVAKAGDRSIGAYEYITPVLKGNSIDNTIANISKSMQGKVMFDKRCSTHVHVGAFGDDNTLSRMQSPEFTSAALRLGAHLEDEWFGIMPFFRYNTRYHCYSIKPYKGINSRNYNKLMGAYCHGDHESQMTQSDRESAWDLNNGSTSTSRWHGARYKWLNLVSLLKVYGSSTGSPIRTIEFRLFPGTVNQEELFLYVMMSMCFVEFALNHQDKIANELYDVNSELIFNTVIKDYKVRRRVISLFKQIKSINENKLA